MNANSFGTSSTDQLMLGDRVTQVTADTGSTVTTYFQHILNAVLMFHTFVQFLPSLYSTQLSELGRSVVNLCSIVPGGLVCFFPSYEHERNAFAFWQQSGILDSISKKKQVRMCVWLQALCTLPGAMCFISLVLFLFVVTPVDYCPCLWTGMCSFLVWTVTDVMSCHWVSVCCLLLANWVDLHTPEMFISGTSTWQGVRLNELQTWLTFYVCTLFRCWVVCACTILPSLLATSRSSGSPDWHRSWTQCSLSMQDAPRCGVDVLAHQ